MFSLERKIDDLFCDKSKEKRNQINELVNTYYNKNKRKRLSNNSGDFSRENIDKPLDQLLKIFGKEKSLRIFNSVISQGDKEKYVLNILESASRFEEDTQDLVLEYLNSWLEYWHSGHNKNEMDYVKGLFDGMLENFEKITVDEKEARVFLDIAKEFKEKEDSKNCSTNVRFQNDLLLEISDLKTNYKDHFHSFIDLFSKSDIKLKERIISSLAELKGRRHTFSSELKAGGTRCTMPVSAKNIQNEYDKLVELYLNNDVQNILLSPNYQDSHIQEKIFSLLQTSLKSSEQSEYVIKLFKNKDVQNLFSESSAAIYDSPKESEGQLSDFSKIFRRADVQSLFRGDQNEVILAYDIAKISQDAPDYLENFLKIVKEYHKQSSGLKCAVYHKIKQILDQDIGRIQDFIDTLDRKDVQELIFAQENYELKEKLFSLTDYFSKKEEDLFSNFLKVANEYKDSPEDIQKTLYDLLDSISKVNEDQLDNVLSLAIQYKDHDSFVRKELFNWVKNNNIKKSSHCSRLIFPGLINKELSEILERFNRSESQEILKTFSDNTNKQCVLFEIVNNETEYDKLSTLLTLFKRKDVYDMFDKLNIFTDEFFKNLCFATEKISRYQNDYLGTFLKLVNSQVNEIDSKKNDRFFDELKQISCNENVLSYLFDELDKDKIDYDDFSPILALMSDNNSHLNDIIFSKNYDYNLFISLALDKKDSVIDDLLRLSEFDYFKTYSLFGGLVPFTYQAEFDKKFSEKDNDERSKILSNSVNRYFDSLDDKVLKKLIDIGLANKVNSVKLFGLIYSQLDYDYDEDTGKYHKLFGKWIPNPYAFEFDVSEEFSCSFEGEGNFPFLFDTPKEIYVFESDALIKELDFLRNFVEASGGSAVDNLKFYYGQIEKFDLQDIHSCLDVYLDIYKKNRDRLGLKGSSRFGIKNIDAVLFDMLRSTKEEDRPQLIYDLNVTQLKFVVISEYDGSDLDKETKEFLIKDLCNWDKMSWSKADFWSIVDNFERNEDAGWRDYFGVCKSDVGLKQNKIINVGDYCKKLKEYVGWVGDVFENDEKRSWDDYLDLIVDEKIKNNFDEDDFITPEIFLEKINEKLVVRKKNVYSFNKKDSLYDIFLRTAFYLDFNLFLKEQDFDELVVNRKKVCDYSKFLIKKKAEVSEIETVYSDFETYIGFLEKALQEKFDMPKNDKKRILTRGLSKLLQKDENLLPKTNSDSFDSIYFVPGYGLIDEFSGVMGNACYFVNEINFISNRPEIINIRIVKDYISEKELEKIISGESPLEANPKILGNVLGIRGYVKENDNLIPTLVIRADNPHLNNHDLKQYTEKIEQYFDEQFKKVLEKEDYSGKYIIARPNDVSSNSRITNDKQLFDALKERRLKQFRKIDVINKHNGLIKFNNMSLDNCYLINQGEIRK